MRTKIFIGLLAFILFKPLPPEATYRGVATLCVMERTTGETPTDLGYQHFIKFPQWGTWEKAVANTYDAGWNWDANDAGQCIVVHDTAFQVNCKGRKVMMFTDPFYMSNYVGVACSTKAPFNDNTFRPVGITFKADTFYVLTSYSGTTTTLAKYSPGWAYYDSVALDHSTYGEHDGLGWDYANNLVSSTEYGYVVRFNLGGTYQSATELLNGGFKFRGAAVLDSTLIIAKMWNRTTLSADTKILILNFPTISIIDSVDLSAYLNTAGNCTYGTFFLTEATHPQVVGEGFFYNWNKN